MFVRLVLRGPRARSWAENLVRAGEMSRSMRAVRNDGTIHDDGVEAVVFRARESGHYDGGRDHDDGGGGHAEEKEEASKE